MVALNAVDQLPECPTCGGRSFARASIFSADSGGQAVPMEDEPPATLEALRERAQEPGHYLGLVDDERATLIPLTREWTRIGRSVAADVRLDDPTVSRRHAILVRQADGVRVLDDRSLNGVFVNGRKQEWSWLRDGDHLNIGRYHLLFIEVSSQGTPGPRSPRILSNSA